jgi:predicted nucleic acid-binding protein
VPEGSTKTSANLPTPSRPPLERYSPRVDDARFAALAIEAGCEWITLDRDYARFPGLRWRVPQAGE